MTDARMTPHAPSAIVHSKPSIEADDLAAVNAVLRSCQLANGTLTREFEREFGAFVGLGTGVATSSGTSALALALTAFDVAGGEVVIPTYVCRSVYDAVVAAGAEPVLADVSDDWCMGAANVSAVVTPRTRAVVAVHTFGIAADVEAIAKLGFPVVEDCAQSIGARINGRAVGTIGHAAIFSFHATKLLTSGEGGMVVSRDETVVANVRGAMRDGLGRLAGRLAPMSDLAAALGLSQLRRWDTFAARRRTIADRYFAELEGIDAELPRNVSDRSAFYRFTLRTRRSFDELRAAFDGHGVHVRRGVDALLHRIFGMPDERFPNATRLYGETLSIPIYPALTDDEVTTVVRAFHEVFERSVVLAGSRGTPRNPEELRGTPKREDA